MKIKENKDRHKVLATYKVIFRDVVIAGGTDNQG